MIFLKKNSGFTLIELLVVISIIGMLSSVVLASVSSARDKGRVTAAMTFSTNIYRGFGDDLLLGWDFDETPLVDLGPERATFRGVSGAGVVAPVLSDVVTPIGNGKSLQVNPGGVYGLITFPNSSTVEHTDLTTSFWVYVDSATIPGGTPDPFINLLSTITFYNPMNIQIVNGNLQCEIANVSPSYNYTITKANALQGRKWHHVACTVEAASGKVTLFVDGKIASEGAVAAGSYDGNFSSVNIGRSFPSGGPLNVTAYYDDVMVFGRTLLATEVGEIYLAGLSKRLSLVNR